MSGSDWIELLSDIVLIYCCLSSFDQFDLPQSQERHDDVGIRAVQLLLADKDVGLSIRVFVYFAAKPFRATYLPLAGVEPLNAMGECSV